jgi:putative colanic acid biosynthesis UDP-glucose lipid carrier transferase
MDTIKRGVLQANASVVSIVQRIADIVIVISSLSLACKFDQSGWKKEYWIAALAVIVFYQMIAEASNFYRSWRGVSVTKEITYVCAIWSISFAVISLLGFYVVNEPLIAINLQIKWFLVTVTGLSMTHFMLRYVMGVIRTKGYNSRTAVIVGATNVGEYLAEQLHNAPWLGIHVVGFYDDKATGSCNVNDIQIPVLGELEQLIADAKGGKIDRIYITLPMRYEERIRYIVTELSDTTCSVLLVPDVFTFNLLNSRSQEINGIPLISIFDTPMIGFNAFVKRFEDIVLASLIIILISPILLALAFAVKLTSAGPVIFRQQRYGIDGKSINVWKFRSMKVMENGTEVVQAKKNDSRLTPIGAFIRSTSLDELPQFINVLKGDMSIVGPRPHAVAHNEQYRKIIKGYMLRHKVKPGITGLAQISGWRGETDTLEKMEKRIECDLEYIRTWSVWLDLKIVFFTIFKGFINKNAY